MNIAFRTDATHQIGTGHFMRCLTLAEALKQRGARIHFMSRNLPAYLQDMLIAKGMELARLDNYTTSAPDDLPYAHWLGISQASDAEAALQGMSDQTWDWLVVDHYALDARWEKAMRPSTHKILVIDDLADRQHDCDILLDQNFYTDMHLRYIDKVPAHCRLLLGPRYALLRDEFRQLREQIKPREGPIKRILVFFGGVDADNCTGQAIEALVNIGIEGLHVDVVIGALHPCRTAIESKCDNYGFICHVQTDRMAELMATADLAIGAGGSATWERCCLGLPTLAICTAHNQKKQVADAALEGLLYSPDIKSHLNQVIRKHTNTLIENSCMRQHLSRNCMKAIDGRGTLRVAREIDDFNVEVRLATNEDAKLVWPWRNHVSTRRYFFDPNPVDLEKHLTWWNQSLLDPKRILLLGYLNDKAIGVLRYDLTSPQNVEVSIYLDPAMTSQGMGACLLRSGRNWLKQNHPEINIIIANVMSKNAASLRVFLSAGFQEQYTVFYG